MKFDDILKAEQSRTLLEDVLAGIRSREDVQLRYARKYGAPLADPPVTAEEQQACIQMCMQVPGMDFDTGKRLIRDPDVVKFAANGTPLRLDLLGCLSLDPLPRVGPIYGLWVRQSVRAVRRFSWHKNLSTRQRCDDNRLDLAGAVARRVAGEAT
jgi:hypothetical protein